LHPTALEGTGLTGIRFPLRQGSGGQAANLIPVKEYGRLRVNSVLNFPLLIQFHIPNLTILCKKGGLMLKKTSGY